MSECKTQQQFDQINHEEKLVSHLVLAERELHLLLFGVVPTTQYRKQWIRSKLLQLAQLHHAWSQF